MTITVELTEQEIGLLRAGLAAHSIALAQYPNQQVAQQRDDVRTLSIRLGEAQVAASAAAQQ